MKSNRDGIELVKVKRFRKTLIIDKNQSEIKHLSKERASNIELIGCQNLKYLNLEILKNRRFENLWVLDLKNC